VKGEVVGIGAAPALARLLLLRWPPAASELMRRRDSPAAPAPRPRPAALGGRAW
jgi:hypothetical protein